MAKTASGLSRTALQGVKSATPTGSEWEAHAIRGAELEGKGENFQWDAKAEYEEAWKLGATERQIAAKAGKSDTHIHWLLTMVSRTEAELESCNFADAYAAAKAGIELGGLKSSTSVEWYTPSRYIEAARTVMGGIDLDPASNAMANELVAAATYFDEEADGLAHQWRGRVWLNPPYGKGSGLFTAKLVEEYDADRVTQAVLLLNAYGFDAAWFQPLWAHPICFTDHRIEFYSPQHKSGGPANGNIFAYLGPVPTAFAEVFQQFGQVVRAWP